MYRPPGAVSSESAFRGFRPIMYFLLTFGEVPPEVGFTNNKKVIPWPNRWGKVGGDTPQKYEDAPQ